jgi:hypothetical protein
MDYGGRNFPGAQSNVEYHEQRERNVDQNPGVAQWGVGYNVWMGGAARWRHPTQSWIMDEAPAGEGERSLSEPLRWGLAPLQLLLMDYSARNGKVSLVTAIPCTCAHMAYHPRRRYGINAARRPRSNQHTVGAAHLEVCDGTVTTPPKSLPVPWPPARSFR